MSIWIFVLCQLCVLAFAMMGGVFLAFSDFIMRSLDRVAAPAGVDAMNMINREIFRSVFMALFFGLAVASVFLFLHAALTLPAPAAVPIMAAAALYLFGVFGATAVFNVPLNQRLAALGPDAAAAQSFWKGTYLSRWTWWNSVRTVACLLAAGLLMVGLHGLELG